MRVAPNFYNESTEEWLLSLRFAGLSAPSGSDSLRFVAELLDAKDNVLMSDPVDVLIP